MGSKRSPPGWPHCDLIVRSAFYRTVTVIDDVLYVRSITISIPQKARGKEPRE